MTISDVVAKGTYAVEAPSRSVTGTATIDAWRAAKSDPWAFNALSVEFDAAAVASANAERDAVAARAGYSDGASDQAEATVNPGEKLVIRVV